MLVSKKKIYLYTEFFTYIFLYILVFPGFPCSGSCGVLAQISCPTHGGGSLTDGNWAGLSQL